MKLNQLNLGTSLSKDEQKQIKGGTPICNVGYFAQCFCNDGTTILAPGDGVHTTAILCGYPYIGTEDVCYYHGKIRNPGGCVS